MGQLVVRNMCAQTRLGLECETSRPQSTHHPASSKLQRGVPVPTHTHHAHQRWLPSCMRAAPLLLLWKAPLLLLALAEFWLAAHKC